MNSSLAYESALAVLIDLCPELGDDTREALSKLVVERTTSLSVLKIAGLMMADDPSSEAALTLARQLEPHAHTRKVMPLLTN